MNREELLATAVAVGLVLGVDFEKNISNANLQKKIKDKQLALTEQLKGNQSEDNVENKDNHTDLNGIENQINSNDEKQLKGNEPVNPTDDEVLFSVLKGLDAGEIKEEDLIDYDKELLSKHRQSIAEALVVSADLLGTELERNTATKNFITDKEKIEDLEDNALIMRKTECFTYRTEIIGFKETARRSNLTIEEVKEAIETEKPAGGYIFEFVG